MSKKSKRKSYFSSSNPKKKIKSGTNLSAGMRGFLCTCNGNEKGCIREALNLLDEYVSRLNQNNPHEESNIEADDDVEKALKKEINDAKVPQKFKPVDTGANNCIFVSTLIDDPIGVAEAIMKDVKETKFAKNRYLIRLIPVFITCKAYNDDIKKAADSIFDVFFKCEPTTYCIYVNKRSNNNLLRTEVTENLVQLVRDRNINHKVDLKNPIKTVVVEIIRNICCLSVVNNFFGYRKYNLIELASNEKAEVSNSHEKTGNQKSKETPAISETSDPSMESGTVNLSLVNEKNEELPVVQS